MYDFACQIAAGEKFPSLVFGFEPLHSTVFVHNSLVPKGVKFAVVCWVYSVILVLNLVSHDDVVPGRLMP